MGRPRRAPGPRAFRTTVLVQGSGNSASACGRPDAAPSALKEAACGVRDPEGGGEAREGERPQGRRRSAGGGRGGGGLRGLEEEFLSRVWFSAKCSGHQSVVSPGRVQNTNRFLFLFLQTKWRPV